MAALLTPEKLDAMGLLLQEEIQVLRTLLATFTEEKQAILSKNDDMLSAILEERLCVLDYYEHLAEQILDLALPLVCNPGTSPEGTFKAVLESLGDSLDAEYIELHSQREQVLALLNEIDFRNTMADLYVQREALPRTPQQPKSQKVTLGLLEKDFTI